MDVSVSSRRWGSLEGAVFLGEAAMIRLFFSDRKAVEGRIAPRRRGDRAGPARGPGSAGNPYKVLALSPLRPEATGLPIETKGEFIFPKK